MAHMTQNAIDAVNEGEIPISLLELDLPDGSTYRAVHGPGRHSASFFFDGLVQKWSPITYGSSDRTGLPERVTAAVEVVDPDRTLIQVLTGAEGRDVRGAAARIKAATRGLDESDWWSLFTGVIQSWSMPEPFVVNMRLRLDDDALKGDGHQSFITADDFPTAPDESRGAHIPVVYGIHDNTGTTVTGMLPTVKVSTDGHPADKTTKPHRYAISVGRLPDVLSYSIAGASKVTVGAKDTDWFWEQRNGRVFTTIGFATDQGDDVAVDAWGLADTATPTSDPADDSEVLKNPVDQLQNYLVNFVFNSWNDGTNRSAWFDPDADASIDALAWSLARGHFVERGATGARAVPNQSISQLMQEWFDSWQVAFYWTEDGNLALALNDPHTYGDSLYTPPQFTREDARGRLFRYEPNPEQVIGRINHRFFLIEDTGEFLAARTIHDPSVSEQREESIDMPWSAAEEPNL